ncbi:MAG TPA: SCO family protein [Ktedonobacterales bacterium]|nr:SCO family protein [Ktedonobacterales bacterium]
MGRPAGSTKARPHGGARTSEGVGARRQGEAARKSSLPAHGRSYRANVAPSAKAKAPAQPQPVRAIQANVVAPKPAGAAPSASKAKAENSVKAPTPQAAAKMPAKTKAPKRPQLSQLSKIPMRWLAFGVILVALIVSTVALYRAFGPNTGANTSGNNVSAGALQGDDLGGAQAPNFTLHDQNGQAVSLSSLRGHVIALTFFDSLCPHTDCSLMASYVMASAHLMSPQERAQVDWLAISLNPWHDTPATAKAFLSSHGVTIPMRYLLGSLGQVAPIWSDYHMESILQSNGIVIHTTGLYVIDQQGLERVFLEEGFDPHSLAGDLHLLLTKHIPVSAGATAQTDGSVSMTQTVSNGTLTLRAIPGQYGSYDFELWVWDAQQQPVQEATATLSLTMTDMVMQPVQATFQPEADIGPGVYSAHSVVSMAGHARVVVTAQPSSGGPPIQATFYFTAKY